MRRKPNFFMVGAPKCGTTALYEYLRTHPNIFMCDPKEPHFFAEDFPRRFAETMDEYLELFNDCNDEHIAIGEASIWYLYSSVALKNIFEFNQHAKIIVTIRNPVDMICSLHSENLYNHNEDIDDFEQALRLQEARSKGGNLPSQCRQPLMLQYTDIGMLSKWLKRVTTIFPREQVKVLLFDDLVQSARSTYEDVLDFLNVPYDGRAVFPRINENKAHRVHLLGKFLQHPPIVLRQLVKKTRRVTGIDLRKLALRIRQLNTKGVQRPRLDPRARARLVTEFRSDIEVLEQMLDRDLSHWKEGLN